MKTIRQNDLLKMLLKGGIEIEYGVNILVWDTHKKNNFDNKGVIVGSITENTFDMLCDEGIILYSIRTCRYRLGIEGRGN